MTSPVTASDIHQDIRHARGLVNEAIRLERDATAAEIKTEIVYKREYAQAFIRHKENGADVELAKQKTHLDTENEYNEWVQAKELRRSYRLEAQAWEKILKGHAALSWALRSELEAFKVPS